MSDVQDKILKELSSIRKLLEKTTDHRNYTYSVVRINDDETQFAASMAHLANNGFEFVDIIHKNLGKYQVLVKRKVEESENETK